MLFVPQFLFLEEGHLPPRSHVEMDSGGTNGAGPSCLFPSSEGLGRPEAPEAQPVTPVLGLRGQAGVVRGAAHRATGSGLGGTSFS